MDRLWSEAVSARLRPRRALEMAAVFVLLSTGSIAHAAPPKPPKPSAKTAPKPPAPAPATKSYDEAVALSAAGNHEAALAIFRKLTLIDARRGAASALDKLGRTDEAVAEYEAYIAGAPPSADEHVRAARARVAELRAVKRKVRVVTVPPGATIEVTGQPASKSPADLELSVGKHLLHASLAGSEPATREVEVLPGAPPQEVMIDLDPAVAATPIAPAGSAHASTTTAAAAAAPPQGIDSLGAPIVTGTLGALSLGAGIYFGLSALTKKSAYDDNPSESRLASAETAAALSTAGIVGGVVLGAVTVVLFLTTPATVDGPSRAAIRANGLQLRF